MGTAAKVFCLSILLTLSSYGVDAALKKCSRLNFYKHWYLNTENNHCYFVSQTVAYSWRNATAECRRKDKDAKLVALQTDAEFEWLDNHLKNDLNVGSYRTYWTGGADAGPEIGGYWWLTTLPGEGPEKIKLTGAYKWNWCQKDEEPEFPSSNRAVALGNCGPEGRDLVTRPDHYNYRYICEIKKSKLGITDFKASFTGGK